MATRQEIMTAWSLGIATLRTNKTNADLITILEGTGTYSGMSFATRQPLAISSNAHIIDKTPIASTFVTLVNNNTFLNNGLADVFEFDLDDVNDDNTDNYGLSIAQANAIANAPNDIALAALSAVFSGFSHVCGQSVPDPRSVIDSQILRANIIHDIFDAMSYELQGLNSYTGISHGMDAAGVKSLISGRINALNIELSNLSNKENFETIRDYIEANYMEADLSGLSSIGSYIDANLSKLIILRRSWAL